MRHVMTGEPAADLLAAWQRASRLLGWISPLPSANSKALILMSLVSPLFLLGSIKCRPGAARPCTTGRQGVAW